MENKVDWNMPPVNKMAGWKQVEDRERKFALCKMFAAHPFEEAYIISQNRTSTIVGVNFASQEILLRDFSWYDVDDVKLNVTIEEQSNTNQ